MSSKTQSINVVLIASLSVLGLLGSIALLWYSYSSELNRVRAEALETGMNLVQRSGQMFMVSTKKFSEQFEAADSAEKKAEVKADWIRTIVAVDQAVINDFGADTSRVRLLGDAAITGNAPLGGKDTQLETPFERSVLSDFASGRADPIIQTDADNAYLRIAVPLHSSMHAGCAQCHDLPVQSKELLGGLTAYVPLGDKVAAAETMAFKQGGILVAVFLAIMVTLYLLLKHRVLKPLNELRTTTASLAQGNGDLTYRIPTKGNDEIGELGENLNAFMEKLHGIFSDISAVTTEVKSATDQASEASTQTAANMDRQRNQTQAVKVAMAQMDTTVGEMASSTADAADSVRQADERAKQEAARITETADELEALSQTLANAEEVVQRLASDSENIGGILDVIRNIAEQTNLLALNAAIEAARAGDQGRGFAVVADEVRTLAQRTQTSIQEIESMIDRLQSAAGQAAQVMEDGHQRGARAVERSQASSSALQSLINSFSSIADMNLVLASSAEQQSVTVAEIHQSINEINGLSEQTASQAHGASQVSADLTSLAGQLSSKVGSFRI